MKDCQRICILFYIGLLFSGDSAFPLENGQRQMGIFQPRIYGMKNNVEISTHPLLFIVKPNVKIKKYHGEIKGLALASRYSFDYPTLFLKLLQRDGIGGILADDPDIGKIPQLFVFQGEWLNTKRFSNYNITGKVGMSICPGCEIDKRHLIDLPLAYPRMAIYHYGIAANSGVDMDYHSDKISIKTDLDLIFLPEEDIFLEHKLLYKYQLSTKYILSVGYKLAYGKYPYGKQLDIFPLMDLNWRWKK